jgi:putative salt-induced outer membrane protein YdiY
MSQPHRSVSLILFLAIFAPAVLRADEVLFKNGDRLVGTVTDFDGTKLTIDTKVAGKVTVDMKDVKTFSSSSPLELMLNNGKMVRGTIAEGPDGQVSVAQANEAAQLVPLSDLEKLSPPVKWTGTVTIGGLIARGNTETDSLNALGHAERRTFNDRIILDGGYIFGTQKVPGGSWHETANDLYGSAEYDYFFSKKFYGYGNIRADHDTIAGIDLRLAPGVGAGYQWFEKPSFNFNTEGGAGWLYRQYAHDGEDSAASARAAYHLKVKFNDKVSGFHDFEYLPGLNNINNYFFDTDAGIRATVTGHFFTEFSVYYQYDSRPAPGKGPNDIRFILGVGWNF